MTLPPTLVRNYTAYIGSVKALKWHRVTNKYLLTQYVELRPLTSQRYPSGDIGGDALELPRVFRRVHPREVQVTAVLVPVGHGIRIKDGTTNSTCEHFHSTVVLD